MSQPSVISGLQMWMRAPQTVILWMLPPPTVIDEELGICKKQSEQGNKISPRELSSGCLWRSSPQELCWCPHWTLGPVWRSLGIGIHSMGLRTRALKLVRPGALSHARAAMQLWTAGQPPWENHFLPCKMEALIQSSPWLVLRTQWGYWTRELLRPETDTEQDSVSGYDWGWWHLPETLPECLQHQGCWCWTL